MNILWQNEHYPDPIKGGGGAINTYYIVRALQELGHNAVILARGSRNGACPRENYKETVVQRMDPPNLPEWCWPIWPLLEPIYTLETFKDIGASFDAFVGIDFWYALNVKKLFPKKPLIYRVEGSEKTHDEAVNALGLPGGNGNPNNTSSRLESWLRIENDFMERRAWQASDALVVKSDFMKREISRRYQIAPDKLHVIPNGVDSERFQKGIPTETILSQLGKLQRKRVVIMSCGRLVPMKNVSFLVEAFAAMKHRSEAMLAIVGEGSERSHLEQQVRQLGLSSEVVFVGHTDRVEDYLAAADIFVLPSIYEPFGNALIEAMVAGLPCVALKPNRDRIHTASDEILVGGQTGMLVSTESPTYLANALDTLVEAPNLRLYLGAKARVAANDKYNWHKCAHAYLALSDEIAMRLAPRNNP